MALLVTVRILTLYDRVQLRFVAPQGLGMPGDVKDYLTRKGVPFKEYAGSIEQAIPGTDVLYVTRIQKERFASEKEYLAASENYVVNFKTMSGAKQRMAVLHPLPR